ncbi:hypothetical protein EJ073_04900 [Mesorhizobium sp. M4B.F.Ca.ET.058.02.1.1]|nr:hypothetical protein EJ073_04900 [Mesorhizobium sp. M4B.F.Ca.ET.058.02.1.1]
MVSAELLLGGKLDRDGDGVACETLC